MKRRRFLQAVGGGTMVWPVTALAQQPAVPLIGYLSSRSPGDAAGVVAAFHRGLAETGYIQGRNLIIEYRWAEGRYDRLPALAAELIDRRVAVIVATGGSVSGLAAKALTKTIPIVFSSGGDAVKLGLVSSLSRPGGNVTGVNLIFGALGPKRLELLREIIPKATAIALLVNPNYPSVSTEVAEVQTAARILGLDIVVFNAPAESDFEPAFAALAERKVGGLLVGDDPFLLSRRDQLVQLAARHAVPTMYFTRDFVDAGGLLSYGPSTTDALRVVGVYTGRVLKGDKPADLPVVQPTIFELVINLRTAKALGLSIPASFLARADEVIE